MIPQMLRKGMKFKFRSDMVSTSPILAPHCSQNDLLKLQSRVYTTLLKTLQVHPLFFFLSFFISFFFFFLPLIFWTFYFLLGYSQLTSVVIISHWRDSAIHKHVSILPQTPLPSRLLPGLWDPPGPGVESMSPAWGIHNHLWTGDPTSELLWCASVALSVIAGWPVES